MQRNIKREALPTCVSLSVRLSIIITNIVLRIIIIIVANIIAIMITFTILLWVPYLLWCGPSLVAASVAFQNCLKCIFVSTSVIFNSFKNLFANWFTPVYLSESLFQTMATESWMILSNKNICEYSCLKQLLLILLTEQCSPWPVVRVTTSTKTSLLVS